MNTNAWHHLVMLNLKKYYAKLVLTENEYMKDVISQSTTYL